MTTFFWLWSTVVLKDGPPSSFCCCIKKEKEILNRFKIYGTYHLGHMTVHKQVSEVKKVLKIFK